MIITEEYSPEDLDIIQLFESLSVSYDNENQQENEYDDLEEENDEEEEDWEDEDEDDDEDEDEDNENDEYEDEDDPDPRNLPPIEIISDNIIFTEATTASEVFDWSLIKNPKNKNKVPCANLYTLSNKDINNYLINLDGLNISDFSRLFITYLINHVTDKVFLKNDGVFNGKGLTKYYIIFELDNLVIHSELLEKFETSVYVKLYIEELEDKIRVASLYIKGKEITLKNVINKENFYIHSHSVRDNNSSLTSRNFSVTPMCTGSSSVTRWFKKKEISLELIEFFTYNILGYLSSESTTTNPFCRIGELPFKDNLTVVDTSIKYRDSDYVRNFEPNIDHFNISNIDPQMMLKDFVNVPETKVLFKKYENSDISYPIINATDSVIASMFKKPDKLQSSVYYNTIKQKYYNYSFSNNNRIEEVIRYFKICPLKKSSSLALTNVISIVKDSKENTANIYYSSNVYLPVNIDINVDNITINNKDENDSICYFIEYVKLLKFIIESSQLSLLNNNKNYGKKMYPAYRKFLSSKSKIFM